jgi:nucleotide-binding universal stress UspA family protein
VQSDLEASGTLTQSWKKRSPFTHVLVPTDGSAASIDAGRLAIKIASVHQIPMTFLYVVNRQTAEDIANSSPDKDVDGVCQELGDKAKRYLDYLARAASNEGLEAEQVIKYGIPYQEIANLAHERSIDLIVMGQVGGRGTQQHHRAHIGSVAEHVIEHAPCPVLIVKHTPGRR